MVHWEYLDIIRSWGSHQRWSIRKGKGVLWNFAKLTGKHLCQGLSFNINETLALVFSCEFCEISKNTFSYRTPLVAASSTYWSKWSKKNFCPKLCSNESWISATWNNDIINSVYKTETKETICIFYMLFLPAQILKAQGFMYDDA